MGSHKRINLSDKAYHPSLAICREILAANDPVKALWRKLRQVSRELEEAKREAEYWKKKAASRATMP